MNVSKFFIVVLLAVVGGVAEAQDQPKKFALNFTVKEMVGLKLVSAQGFLVVKPSPDPSQPRKYLAYGGAYLLIVAGDDGKAAIDSVTFTSTRQSKVFRLPLAGEKSLSKFWVTQSLDIEVTIKADGTVGLTVKPTIVFRFPPASPPG